MIMGDLTPDDVREERARWLAFGFAEPGADPGKTAVDVMTEQVAAFDDPEDEDAARSAQVDVHELGMNQDATDVILAHEIEHGLQDQDFGIPDMHKLRTGQSGDGDAGTV